MRPLTWEADTAAGYLAQLRLHATGKIASEAKHINQPIACSLSAAELGDRERAWHKLLSRSLLSRERVPGGLRLTVHSGSSEALSKLVGLERECCPWIKFELSDAIVTMTADGPGEQALLQLFTAPTTQAT